MMITRFFRLLCGLFLLGMVASLHGDDPSPTTETDYTPFGVYEDSAPRAEQTEPVVTRLPLDLRPRSRIAYIGNTLLDRAQHFGYFEAMLHTHFPEHQLTVRNLAWSADEITLRPRPDNFADLDQHLTHEKADVIFAAFGFNESFQGEAGLDQFRASLVEFVNELRSKAFNGKHGPRVILISPIANEDIEGVAAASLNNDNIKRYADVMREVAREQQIGFVDVFEPTRQAMASPGTDLTINGCHLTEAGYELFAKTLFEACFGTAPPSLNPALRQAVLNKNRQYFRRYRPLNTFYYTGGRSKTYGYLDFLPAMRNFDQMVANRDRRIWDLAQGREVPAIVDDTNLPPLPKPLQERGANEWMSAADERKAFKVDPRFEVNLFASEEEFPDIANPIQMRWDSRGRLWVSCSTTYPHVYPGNEPNDKLVILEDTNGDGKADRSTVFADDLHIPLSFEFGDGGVYVSEMPHLTFLKDTTGDGKADLRRQLLTGFGTEDSHHAIHDFTWTPDGDLIFREAIFHHSQVETPYGPVRQQNSGWFRYEPATHRLISFGSYPSTNPWGVTFDDWGQHVASHPVYAAAFHALDPKYPEQHPRPQGLQAYSGVCGHEFIDFQTFPADLQGHFVKVRYKPTNRVEIHKWKETPFGYDEEYVGDIIFSTNLSFIPVDLRFGPDGALYVCDWYNPVKGHMQYSLRDDRRDRHSGRIWRITTKGKPVQNPSGIADASIAELIELLKRPEYRYRYWAKRELRERDAEAVTRALDVWVNSLDPNEPRFRHHQIEAIWAYRWVRAVRVELLRELLSCENYHARAAATQQLRYWHSHLPDAIDLLKNAANDMNGIVRMEAAIAASYIGSRDALDAMLDVFKHPRGGHLEYAIMCALGSHTLKPHWEDNPDYQIADLIKQANRTVAVKEPTPTAAQAQFDQQEHLKVVNISCEPERMLFTLKQFTVTPGQPVKVVFANPDATDHNLVFVNPNALAEVGMAANEMAKDPRNANSDFIPPQKRDLIIHASRMIGPNRAHQIDVLRFNAPKQPGIYPYVCTFPGHWIVMNGVMAVGETPEEADALLKDFEPKVVKKWTLDDFPNLTTSHDESTVMQGMAAFHKARCTQCHALAGHGVNLGPDLSTVNQRFKGKKLLRVILEPSSDIHEKYQNQQLYMRDGRVTTGVMIKETNREYHVMTNLLTPKSITVLKKADVEDRIISKVSPMPTGLVDVLTKDEIQDLVSYLESGAKHDHSHP